MMHWREDSHEVVIEARSYHRNAMKLKEQERTDLKLGRPSRKELSIDFT